MDGALLTVDVCIERPGRGLVVLFSFWILVLAGSILILKLCRCYVGDGIGGLNLRSFNLLSLAERFKLLSGRSSRGFASSSGN